MRLDVVPENLLDRIALRFGLVPKPMLHSLLAAGLARLLVSATRLGLFEAIGRGAKTVEELAREMDLDPLALRKALNGLVGIGYMRYDDGRYALTRDARKWVLGDSPQSLRDWLLEQNDLEFAWLDSAEDYVRTGRPIEMHEVMDDEQWGLYQRGMRAVAGVSAGEVARRVPVPKRARRMLDIGGSHGYYSVKICRRHKKLQSTILDLPEAVKHARPLVEREGMGDRVVHRAGNALTDDLGESQFDLVFMANVAHHFSDEENRDLARRVARALNPGGVYAILDFERPESPEKAGQLGTLGDLFFALTSASGTWSFDEMEVYQTEAGLVRPKTMRLRTLPGGGIQAAFKP